jgi:hypothetical protein
MDLNRVVARTARSPLASAVGWRERSETHHRHFRPAQPAMGFAALKSSYNRFLLGPAKKKGARPAPEAAVFPRGYRHLPRPDGMHHRRHGEIRIGRALEGPPSRIFGWSLAATNTASAPPCRLWAGR